MPVAVLVTVTVIPGTAAPVESVTVPVIVPRIVWAEAGRSATRARAARADTIHVHVLARACFISTSAGWRIVSAYKLKCQYTGISMTTYGATMFRAVGSAFSVAAILTCSPVFGAAQEPTALHHAGGFEIAVIGDLKGFALAFDVRTIEAGLDVAALTLTAPTPAPPPRFTLKWSLPSQDVAGQWATGRHLTKTLRPDWSGGRLQASMFAREAPVSCLYGSDDGNVLTFAVSDALDTVLVGSGIREEDGRLYNEVTFFSEPHPSVGAWSAEVRLDRRRVPYWAALRGVSDWWAGQPGYAPAAVPEPARLPVYSTWYNYHQSVDAAVLLKEVAIAKKL